jgi:hypothetical protein
LTARYASSVEWFDGEASWRNIQWSSFHSEQLRRNSTHRSFWGFNALVSFCDVIEKELQSQKSLIGTMIHHLDQHDRSHMEDETCEVKGQMRETHPSKGLINTLQPNISRLERLVYIEFMG